MKTVFYSLLFATILGFLPCNSVFAASTNTPNTQAQSTKNGNLSYLNKNINQVSANQNLNSTQNRTTFASSQGIKISHSRANKPYFEKRSGTKFGTYLHFQNSSSMQTPTLSSKENISLTAAPTSQPFAFQTQSFSKISNNEPFSNNNSSVSTLSGAQKAMAGCAPLNHSEIALISLLGLFLIYKKLL